MPLSENMKIVINDPGAHQFIKRIITDGAGRDIVDVINDLEVVLDLFNEQFKEMTENVHNE